MSEIEERDEHVLAEIERIRSGMNGQDFYFMQHSFVSETPPELVLRHYRWFIQLEKQGAILLTGARMSRDGSRLPGMTIFRADNWEAADQMARSDPFVQEGARTYEIQLVRLGGGRINLSYDLSDRSCVFA